MGMSQALPRLTTASDGAGYVTSAAVRCLSQDRRVHFPAWVLDSMQAYQFVRQVEEEMFALAVIAQLTLLLD